MMKRLLSFLNRAGLIVLTVMMAVAGDAAAQEYGYNRYAPIYHGPAGESRAKQVASDFLTYPLELIRWPLNQSAVFIEKHHIDTKIEHIYDTLLNHGIHPNLGLTTSGWGSAGVELDLVRLTNLKNQYPDLKANTWVGYSDNVYFRTGAEVGWQDLTQTGLGGTGIVNYETRPEEHFYGIGPDTSAGDGTSFRMETTKLGGQLSYDPNPTFHSNLSFSYRNINITDGEDGGRGIIDRIFPAGSIPGLAGDEILSLTTEIIRDTRNHRELSTQGGRQRLAFGYHEGVNGSDARYFSYEAEASHYFELGSERRVLAVHLHGVHNDEVNGGTVPFHQMAKLGGFGAEPRLSAPLRGYDFNRFFDESMILANVEYRYTVWQYRDFQLDAVLFWDEGQVFGEFSEFQMKDFEESYGGGFRLHVANHLLLDLEAAHGDEGTNLYVKTRTSF